VTSAADLFATRGYDDATVAEIASRAGVSVKTLFTYFRSKEDLVFADQDTFLDHILDAVSKRGPDITPLRALTAALQNEIDSDDPAEELEAFHRTIGTSPAVASRLRRMWEEYEDALAALLAAEANEATPSPLTRLTAAQLIAIIRVTTSPEVREFVSAQRAGPPQREALKRLIAEAAQQLENGLGG